MLEVEPERIELAVLAHNLDQLGTEKLPCGENPDNLTFGETVASLLEFFRRRTSLMQDLRGVRAIGRLLVPLHVQRDPLALFLIRSISEAERSTSASLASLYVVVLLIVDLILLCQFGVRPYNEV